MLLGGVVAEVEMKGVRSFRVTVGVRMTVEGECYQDIF